MNKRIHKLLSIISIVCILSLGVSVIAYAATSVADSPNKTSTVFYNTYEYWASVASYDDPSAIGSTCVQSNNVVPTGYMGVYASLYDSSAVLCRHSTWSYNSQATVAMVANTPYYNYYGTYYSKGQVKLYNGNGYTTYDTYQTPYVSNNVTLSSPNAMGIASYQINENGETYGSGLYSDVLGQEPDLIKAYGVDGTIGYVRASDLNSNPRTPEEAIAEQNKNNGERNVPLYDKDGKTVIGIFKIEPAKVQLFDKKIK